MSITIQSDDLKAIVKEALIEVLESRRDFLEEVVSEALEDIGMYRAMQESDGTLVGTKEFLKELDRRITEVEDS